MGSELLDLQGMYKVYIHTYFLRSLALMGKPNAACKKLAASVSSSCFCLTSEKRFQPRDLKAPFSWRNRLLKGACDCWLIRSVLSWKHACLTQTVWPGTWEDSQLSRCKKILWKSVTDSSEVTTGHLKSRWSGKQWLKWESATVLP